MDKYKPKFTKKIYIRAGAADPAPPLGTVLGNLGVSTTVFCQNFNTFSSVLPSYFILKVTILIYDNKSTTFTVEAPSTGVILNLLKFEQEIIKMKKLIGTRLCIDVMEALKLARFIFPHLELHQSFLILFGTIKSTHLHLHVQK
jgi:ribosomal protein L11